MVRQSMLWALTIASLVLVVTTTNIIPASYYVEGTVTIETPPKLSTGTLSELHVVATIKNKGRRATMLHVESPCHILRWVITDGEDNFVQARAKATSRDCQQGAQHYRIKAGEHIRHTVILPLQTRRYKAKTLYRLRVSFWGKEIITPFRFN